MIVFPLRRSVRSKAATSRVHDRLKELGPHIRPTLICNLEGKRFTESGFRSNWHRLMQKALAAGAIGDGGAYPSSPTATLSPATTYRDSNLVSRTGYCYVVTASNANGESARSNEACASPK